MSDQLLRLSKPVPAKYVKRAPGGHGDYVDHEIVNQILLAVCGPFSFQLEQVITSPEGLIEACTASLTIEIDGRTVTVTEAGDCDQPTPPNSKTQGDRLKKAASDALKRCAMRLGLGLHLWAGEKDYFLFEQLLSRPNSATAELDVVGTNATTTNVSSQRPPAGRAPADGASGGGPVSRPTDPPPEHVSGIALHNEQAKVKALQAHGVSVADERKKRHLPLLDDKVTEDEFGRWKQMLAELDRQVTEQERPFTERAS